VGICSSEMVGENYFNLRYLKIISQDSKKKSIKEESVLNFSKVNIEEIENLELIKEIFKDSHFNKEIIKKIKKIKYKNLILFGMGGSSLGIKTIFEGLDYQRKKKKKFYLVDNIDGENFEKIFKEIKIKDSFFIFVSKSGNTIEIKNLLKEALKKINKEKTNCSERILFITENNKSFLNNFAKKKNIKTCHINKNLGGRFSVLSSVSIIPCELLEMNWEEILKGAINTYKELKECEFTAVLYLASFYHQHYLQGRDISILMSYKDNLNAFGQWFMQLWGESLGKQRRDKKNIGLTPINYIGPKDQHSQMQLVLDGPKNKTVTFITVSKSESANRNLEKLSLLEQEATSNAIKERGIPSIKFDIKTLNAPTLGSIFLIFQLTVILLAKNLKINPFNQPAVELIKKRLKS